MKPRQLSDYPSGIQTMFHQAGELLERLNRMEMDYRAWEASDGYRTWQASLDEEVVIEQPVTLAQLVAPSRPEAARLRWEKRVAAVRR